MGTKIPGCHPSLSTTVKGREKNKRGSRKKAIKGFMFEKGGCENNNSG